MIALLLWMRVRPFAKHFKSFHLPGVGLPLLLSLTLISAFRQVRLLAVCVTVLAVIAVALRLAADHWRLPEFDSLGLGQGSISRTLRPNSTASPIDGRCSAASVEFSVVLPAPLSPSKRKISP